MKKLRISEKLRLHESRIKAHVRSFEKINGMFSKFNLEWTSICEAIVNNKDSIEELIAEVNSFFKFKEEAEAEATRRKDEYNLLSNHLDTLESYLSKIKTCGCPEKPTGVNVVYQETVNSQEQSVYGHRETWENDYALPPKTPNVFAIPGGSNTILETKTKVK